MKRIVTGIEMKELDLFTIHEMGMPSLVLMERAALQVVETMKEESISFDKVLVLCGGGNNGADGVAVGRMLFLAGYHPDICVLGKEEHFTEEIKKQIEIAKKYGVSFVSNPCIEKYTTIIDAIFGVGLSRKISGIYKDIILSLEDFPGKIVSVDLPSGICADTGQILGYSVKADLTVTFAYQKVGTCFYPGAYYAGKIVVVDVRIYDKLVTGVNCPIYAAEKSDLRCIQRKDDGNKGTFGKVLLIAGSKDIFGAAFLCGKAVMKTGAGMIKICTRKENRALFSTFPEAMLLTYGDDTDLEKLVQPALLWADVVGIGPGIGVSNQASKLLSCVLKHGKKPLVIDADGLNVLSPFKELLKQYKSSVILTPHLGELARLTGVSPKEWKKNPINYTKTLAKELHAVLICKDARTVIGTKEGVCYINLSGNNGMATAGSGDVLTGVILGLLAQGYSEEYIACLGTYLHGLAGDYEGYKHGRAGLLAGDLIEGIGEILKQLEAGQ